MCKLSERYERVVIKSVVEVRRACSDGRAVARGCGRARMREERRGRSGSIISAAGKGESGERIG